MDTRPPEMTFSVDQFREWEEERDLAAAQIVELQELVVTLDRKMQAALYLFPNLAAPATVAKRDVPEADDVRTWRELILFAMKSAARGLTHSDILAIGRGTSLAERVEQSPGGVYIFTKKMEKRGEIIRRNGLFYFPELWAAIERGDVATPDPQKSRGSQDVVLSVLADGKPRVTRDVNALLKEDPITSKQASGNPNYTYNLLDRMRRQGKLTKLPGSIWVRSDKVNEAPNGNAVGASETGEAATSPIETQPSLRLVR